MSKIPVSKKVRGRRDPKGSKFRNWVTKQFAKLRRTKPESNNNAQA